MTAQWSAPDYRVVSVLCVALLLRIGVVLGLSEPPGSDAADYHQLALSLATHGTFATESGTPTAFRAPGYPAVLAVGYRLAAPQPRVGHLINALTGTVTVAAVWFLGNFVLGARGALLAALLAAFYPSLVLLPRVLLTENLSVPLLALSLGVSAWSLQGGARRSASLLIGLLLGFAILARSASVVPAALLLGVMASPLGAPSAGERLRRLAWVSLGVALCLGPWGLRNKIVLGTPIFLSTEGGITLYSSYWPPEIGGKRVWGNVVDLPDPVGRAGTAAEEVERSSRYRELFLEGIRRDPWRLVRFAPEKVAYLVAPFNWEWFPHAPGRSRSLDWGYLIVLVPAAVGGITLWRQRLPIAILLAVLPAASLFTSLVFYGSPRFRLPADVTTLLLATVGLQRATAWLAGGRR